MARTIDRCRKMGFARAACSRGGSGVEMDVIDARFVAFVGVSAFLIVTPGPDMALITRNALAGGGRAAAFTACGVGLGILGWAVAVALGVAQLLDRSAIAFTVLKFAGAAYLVVLGLRALLGGGAAARDEHGSPGFGPSISAGAALRQGALGNLLNPKAGVIFVSILPQFVMPGDPLPRLLAMLLAFEIMIVGWLVVYGAAVSRVGRSRFGASARRVLERVTGVVLVGLGLRLAVERR
jgi:threonine/homoserine/homoserine lactone efflux protein